MKKTMYSLMLSEDVVAAVDALAYDAGMTRSGMINSILADYVSYRTPEMRMQDIFQSMEQLLGSVSGLKVMLRNSDSLFSLRSAISYKYNPTVHYSVELFHAPGEELGELRVSLRTQNSNLKLCMLQFYQLWCHLESTLPGGTEYAAEGERFTRRWKLRSPAALREGVSEQTLSRAISDYIRAFDAALKEFFRHLDNSPAAVRSVEAIYQSYVRNAELLL